MPIYRDQNNLLQTKGWIDAEKGATQDKDIVVDQFHHVAVFSPSKPLLHNFCMLKLKSSTGNELRKEFQVMFRPKLQHHLICEIDV